MSPLEMASNSELVEELFKRTTFAGLIVYSRNEQKSKNQEHENFVCKTTGDMENTRVLLNKTLEQITRE